jgi:hypothetical protein
MSAPLELMLRRDVSAPRIARRALDEWFGQSIADDGFETAELLVSELVTNAVLHGPGTITVRAQLDDERLLVEVIDEGAGFERTVRGADFDKIGEWGLSLVDCESSRRGLHEGTTHVWFELERSGIPRRSREATFRSGRPGSRPPAPRAQHTHSRRARGSSLCARTRTMLASLRALWADPPTARSLCRRLLPLLSCSLSPGLMQARDRQR